MVNGTISEATGGKFAKEVIQSALQWVFNAESDAEEHYGQTEDEAKLVFKNVFHTGGAENHPLIKGLPSTLTADHMLFAEDLFLRVYNIEYPTDIIGDIMTGGVVGVVRQNALKGIYKGFFKGANDFDSRAELINQVFEDVGGNARAGGQINHSRLRELNMGL